MRYKEDEQAGSKDSFTTFSWNTAISPLTVSFRIPYDKSTEK